MTLGDIVQTLETWWPPSLAEPWDQTGVVLGHPDRGVDTVMLAVDVVDQTVAEAVQANADLIIAHHPLMLRGVTELPETASTGHLVAQLIRHDVALFSAHTNADAVDGGTSDSLGRALGVTGMVPISPSDLPGAGLGRWGYLDTPTRLYDLATRLGQLLPQTAGGVKVSGDADALITRVAICTGAGDSLLSHPDVLASDVYITGDLRHHPASETQQRRLRGRGPALIDVSHFASEWFFLDGVATRLREKHPHLTVTVSEVVTDPWDFVVHPG